MIPKTTVGLLALLLSLTAYTQTDTAFYSYVSKGTIKGIHKVWHTSANDHYFFYAYNDRGRGDSTLTYIRTNDVGANTQVNIKGKDYFKNPYQEDYHISGDSAIWVINGQRASAPFSGQWYQQSIGSPATIAWMVQWARAQKSAKIPVLPDGIVRIPQPLARTVRYQQQSLPLQLVAIYQDPSRLPYYVWLTAEGRFFAWVNSWSATIQRGYEDWCGTLHALQEQQDRPYFAQQVQELSTPLPKRTVFKNVNLFHSASASVQPNMTIEVEQGTIAAIYTTARPMRYLPTDSVIDCKGRFAMPGLWDMHSHYFKTEGIFYTAGGVTHVRDMGNELSLLRHKRSIESDSLIGPHISFLSLLMDKQDTYQAPTGSIIASLEEGYKAIDAHCALGYGQIKLYSAIPPAWVKPLSDYAHRKGMKVAGHIPAFMTAEQAIRSGYDEMTHMNFVFLNFMGDSIDTRTPLRFRLPGREGGQLDLQSEKVQRFVQLMKENNVALDATLAVWEGLFTEGKGDTVTYWKPVMSWLPIDQKPSAIQHNPFAPAEEAAAYRASFLNMKKMLKLLYDSGIQLVAGTDGGSANALHRELELYVEAGIPAPKVLKIATYTAALNCRLQQQYGQIKVGWPADFILIDGNPAQRISDIRRVATVVKGKRLYRPKQLLASEGWTYYE
jgi:hypothetical protein